MDLLPSDRTACLLIPNASPTRAQLLPCSRQAATASSIRRCTLDSTAANAAKVAIERSAPERDCRPSAPDPNDIGDQPIDLR